MPTVAEKWEAAQEARYQAGFECACGALICDCADEERFEAVKAAKLAFIIENVNGEYSNAGTSQGVTDEALPYFRSALASLSLSEKKKLVGSNCEARADRLAGQPDFWIKMLMAGGSWGLDRQALWVLGYPDKGEAEAVIENALDAACERLAEDQAEFDY